MKVIFEYNGGKRKSMHERYAIILRKLKLGTYMTRDMQAQSLREDEELSRLRAEYQEIVGKRAFHGWGAGEIRARIEEAESE